MRRLGIGALIFAAAVVFATAAHSANLIRITTGNKGNLDETRLYVVKYKCSYEESRMLAFTQSVYGMGAFNEITTSFGAEIRSQNAATVPGATADSPLVFNTVVFTHVRKTVAFYSHTTPGPCQTQPGEFYLSGSDNYTVLAKGGYNNVTSIGDIATTLAGIVVSGASAIFPLIHITQPAEFGDRVNNVRDAIKYLGDFLNNFQPPKDGNIDQPKNLQVGLNTVTAYDAFNNRVASLSLDVEPVVSLVKSKNTKFLAAYQAAASKTAISLDGTDDDMRDRCAQIKETYFSSGFRDSSDLAYLLYKRMLAANPAPEKTVICFGDRDIALAALHLLDEKDSPLAVVNAYRITQEMIDNYLPIVPNSDQPHNRASLASDIDAFLYEFGTHLQGKGLIGKQLTHLQGYFVASITLEDRTRDYKVLAMLQPGPALDTLTLSRDDLFTKLKAAGIVRWLCVQRTKRDKYGAPVKFYDPAIDSAVMVIAAKAAPDEELDFNKSTLFGVHVLFAPSKIGEQLHIKEFVFEQRFRDAVLKENPSCVKNTPTSK